MKGDYREREDVPVGSNRQRHRLRANIEREDLTDDDPRDGTPSGGERSDVDADKSNERLLTRAVVHRDGDTDDGNKELADTHHDGTPQEK